jgi:hypothetical protein
MVAARNKGRDKAESVRKECEEVNLKRTEILPDTPSDYHSRLSPIAGLLLYNLSAPFSILNLCPVSFVFCRINDIAFHFDSQFRRFPLWYPNSSLTVIQSCD